MLQKNNCIFSIYYYYYFNFFIYSLRKKENHNYVLLKIIRFKVQNQKEKEKKNVIVTDLYNIYIVAEWNEIFSLNRQLVFLQFFVFFFFIVVHKIIQYLYLMFVLILFLRASKTYMCFSFIYFANSCKS